MEELFGITINTRITGVREGSIILFFEVIFASYNIISNYKNFIDSISLIKDQCHRLLNAALRNEFQENEKSESNFEIKVEVEYPRLNSHETYFREWLDRLLYRSRDSSPLILLSQIPEHRGDGFLYYLLVMNIVLIIFVVILVYKAIIKTYFS